MRRCSPNLDARHRTELNDYSTSARRPALLLWGPTHRMEIGRMLDQLA